MSIVPEPINKAIAKPSAIMKQFCVPPADSDEKVAIDENSIYTVNELVGPEPIVDSFSCATVEHPPFIQNVTTVIEALCDEMTESDMCDFT